MSGVKDGGPAFPINADTNVTSKGEIYPDWCGMSLRDWFAGQAPEAPGWWMRDEFIALDRRVPHPQDGTQAQCDAWDKDADALRMRALVSWRWAYADAMLAAREKRA